MHSKTKTHTRTHRGLRMNTQICCVFVLICSCYQSSILCGWYTMRWAREFLLLYIPHSEIANSCINSCCEAHVYVQNMYIFICGWCVIYWHTHLSPFALAFCYWNDFVCISPYLSFAHMYSLCFYSFVWNLLRVHIRSSSHAFDSVVGSTKHIYTKAWQRVRCAVPCSFTSTTWICIHSVRRESFVYILYRVFDI